jgi:Alpha/beta hydrolase domain
MQNPTRTPVGGFNCKVPINTGGTHWALDAAVKWLQRWVVMGAPPPPAALLATTHVSPVVFKLDANGNALGGVRTPQVDAPIAALGSQGKSGGFCFLFGSTVPYGTAKLASLYADHTNSSRLGAALSTKTGLPVSSYRLMPRNSCALPSPLESPGKAAESIQPHSTYLDRAVQQWYPGSPASPSARPPRQEGPLPDDGLFVCLRSTYRRSEEEKHQEAQEATHLFRSLDTTGPWHLRSPVATPGQVGPNRSDEGDH